MQILWFKRDLRLRDNLALQWALERNHGFGSILPLYIHEPSLIQADDFAAQHSGFIRESLDDLAGQVAALGGRFLELSGEAVKVFEALWQSTKFDFILAHQETGHVASFDRDLAVKDWAKSRGVTFVEVAQNGVLRGSALKADGFDFNRFIAHECGRVIFTPSIQDDRGMFALPALEGVRSEAIPVGRGVDKPLRQRGGRAAAKQAFAAFMNADKINGYPGSISSILKAERNCSRFSPYLAFGVLSAGEVIQRLNRIVTLAEEMGTTQSASFLAANARFFLDRLYWRSGYLQALESDISIEWENGIVEFDGVRERDLSSEEASRRLAAWASGETGYPMIDAAMRMLSQTGWINMRCRGMLSCFASTELWLPWRATGMHLAREFLDYEPAIHWGQMQIHAGTSKMSRPLSYNPVKQAMDHDPDGVFVRAWVPELSMVPTPYIHEPWTMPLSLQQSIGCVLGRDYAHRIVDPSVSKSSKDKIYQLRGELASQRAPTSKAPASKQSVAKDESLQASLF